MTDETNIQRIIDYVRQYGEQYGSEELRRQLLAAGYAPNDVDAAFARLAAFSEGRTPQRLGENAGEIAQNDAEVERMAAYLRQHRDHYSLEALRKQLFQAGKSPAQVELAIARLTAEQPVQSRPRRWPQIILLVVLNTILLPVVAYLLAITFGGIDDAPVTATIITGPALLLIELITGIILLFRQRTAWIGKALLISVVISLVLIVVLVVVGAILLAGTCIMMLRNL